MQSVGIVNLQLAAYPEADSHQGTIVGSTEEHDWMAVLKLHMPQITIELVPQPTLYRNPQLAANRHAHSIAMARLSGVQQEP